MRKFKLDIGALEVESFTTAAGGGTGTVRGRESADMGGDTYFDNTCGKYPTCDDQCKPWTQQKDCPVDPNPDATTRAPYYTCEPDTCVYGGCGTTANMQSCGMPDCSYPYQCH